VNWRWEKRDRRFTRVMPVIEKMLRGATEICTALYEQTPHYLPFHDNEAAGVSLLASGAARSGCYPVAEYPVAKKTWEAVQNKYGIRPSTLKSKHLMRGRADLCVLDKGRYFSFEFKKTSERYTRQLGEKGLRSNLEYFHEYCVEEIDRVDDDEYHHIMAGVIAPVFPKTNEAVLKSFCREVNLAASIGSKKDFKVYFYFSSLSMFG
jgi:hypothetical protein